MGIINIDDVAQQMFAAAASVLGSKSQAALNLARIELPRIAAAMAFIEREYAAGRMSEEEAKLHLRLQENGAKTALLAVEGIELIAVESAVNASLGVVRDVVNAAVGFALV